MNTSLIYNWPFIFLTALGALIIVGCTALPGGAKLFPADSLSPGSKLSGIASDNENIYLLYVHGMGDTKIEFSEGLVLSGVKYIPNSTRNLATDFGDNSCIDGYHKAACRTIVPFPKVYVRGEGLNCKPGNSEDPCILHSMGELRKETISNKKTKKQKSIFTRSTGTMRPNYYRINTHIQILDYQAMLKDQESIVG